MLRSAHLRVSIATAAFAVALAVIVLSGLAESGALCDDAFYYFQISKNAAAGHGFSFDGLHPTNGFHPLLGWIAVPIFGLLHNYPWAPVRIVLLILAFATAATAYVLYRIGKSLGNERAGELMALFFIFSPFAWIIPLRGCEGGLSVLCIALAVWQAARMSEGEVSVRECLKLGALVGLAGLARTENVFLAVGMGGWLLWRTRQPRQLLGFAAAGALVVSPWIIWNLYHWGSVMQVSGAAKVAFKLYHPLPEVKGLSDAGGNLKNVFTHAMQYVAGEEFRKLKWTKTLLLANTAILAAAIACGGIRRPRAILIPVAVLVVLHLAYYAFVQRSYFNWYVLPVILGVVMLQGERIANAHVVIRSVFVVASAVLCVFTLRLFLERYPLKPHGAERELDGLFANLPRIPNGAHVGGWNVGRVGYFGSIRRPDLRFINLDCVVNNDLFAAWKKGRYTEWIEENVESIVEQPQGPLRRDVVMGVGGPLSRIVGDPTKPEFQGAPPADALIIEDFEGESFGEMRVEGDAFGSKPAGGKAKGQGLVLGFRGKGLANSFFTRTDPGVGRLVSATFRITRPRIGFLIGGGNDPEGLRISLIVDGVRVKSATGARSEKLKRVVWTIPELVGHDATIEIVDDAKGAWGHILVDDIYQQ